MNNYKNARGVIPWEKGDELPEDTIARSRERTTEWISVKDRLPEYGAEVLCVDCNNEYFLDSCVKDKNDFWQGHTDEIFKKYYTYWMPLPEPPESDD